MTMNKTNKVVPLIFDTYLAVIKNSVGSKLFKNFYAKVGGRKTDIMENGNLSCAFYVSSALTMLKLIKGIHGTVDSTIKDLRQSGWVVIKKPKIGSVIVWEKMSLGGDDYHKHIGFYIGNEKAISNNSRFGYPTQHHWTFSGKREVEMLFWSSKIK